MKKLFLFWILILVSRVSAGVIYDIDFSENPTQIVILNEKDIVRFDFPVRQYENKTFSTLEEKRNSKYTLNGLEQKLMVREVNEKDNKTALTLFVYGAETPQYFVLAKDNMIKVDFERDNIDDLLIRFYEIKGNKVALVLQKISLENVEKKASFLERLKTNKNIIYYVIGGIIVLFLIVKQKKIREYFSK